jgi:hypothetical protein
MAGPGDVDDPGVGSHAFEFAGLTGKRTPAGMPVEIGVAFCFSRISSAAISDGPASTALL